MRGAGIEAAWQAGFGGLYMASLLGVLASQRPGCVPRFAVAATLLPRCISHCRGLLLDITTFWQVWRCLAVPCNRQLCSH